MRSVRVFSPASVSNVCCGFDVLGFSIEGLGDEIIIKKSNSKGVKVKRIRGYKVPFDAKKNTASVAVQALLDHLHIDQGFDLEIYKNIKPGSGIGSSASSAVGAVYGINKILGSPFEKKELLKFAMCGEFVSSDTAPADNIASSLYGGLILVNNRENYNVIQLPVPDNLYAVIHHPLLEIKTLYSRGILPKTVDLKIASEQLASIAGFVHSLHTGDFDLMQLILKDYLVENYRAEHVPFFREIKNISELNKAICCSISGSGPSVFSLVKNYNEAIKLKSQCDEIYVKNSVEFNSYITGLNSKGVHCL